MMFRAVIRHGNATKCDGAEVAAAAAAVEENTTVAIRIVNSCDGNG
jgi:hypothetical protein